MPKESKQNGIAILRAVLEAASVLRLLVPSFNSFLEEEFSMAMNLVFDLPMLVWTVFIVLLGQFLKKAHLPEWMPPKPVILLAASFLVCSLFGWAKCEAEGFRQVMMIVGVYTLGNGCLVAFLAMFGYDMVKDFLKHQLVAFKEIIAKKKAAKAEKEAQND